MNAGTCAVQHREVLRLVLVFSSEFNVVVVELKVGLSTPSVEPLVFLVFPDRSPDQGSLLA